MNRKLCGRILSFSVPCTILATPGRSDEGYTRKLRLAGAPTEIQTESLPNKILVRYRYACHLDDHNDDILNSDIIENIRKGIFEPMMSR
jgi:hypothetical protein